MNEFMPPAEIWIPGVAAMTVLMIASGFFSSSETALFYLSRDELRRLRRGGSRERTAASLLSDPDRLLTGVLFWNLVVNLLYFATSVVVAQRLVDKEWNAAAGCFSAASLAGIILFGEVLPKSVAVVHRNRMASLVSWPLDLTIRMLDPLAPTLRNVTRMARRAFWPHIRYEPFLQAEDLERAVEASEQSEDVIRQERQVLHNILDLSEISVEEVMRPRGSYVTRSGPVHLSHLQGKLPPGGYVVIRAEKSDRIESAIALSGLSAIPREHLEVSAEEVVHIPWCATLAFTLQLLRERVGNVASVVNEYGETIGIITYEDIADTILVPLPSRAKRLLRRDPVLKIAPGRYHVDGITTLRHLCRRLGIEFEPEKDGLVTLAGMLLDELERLPMVGDECRWRGYTIRVIDVSKQGQLRVMLSTDSDAGARTESSQ